MQSQMQDPLSKPEQILLVEDSPVQAMQTRLIMEKAGYTIQVCPNGSMVLAHIAKTPPDLILLDLHLPDISGQEVAQRIKSAPLLSGIPIIFLTGVFREIQDVIRGLEQADDYIDKNVEEEELVARVRASLRAKRTQRELGRLAQLLFTVSQVGSQFSGLLEPITLPNSVVRLINEHLEYPRVSLYLLDEKGLRLAATTGDDAAELINQQLHISLDENSPLAQCANNGQLVSSTAEKSETLVHPLLKGIRSLVAVPLRSAGKIKGVLEIASPEPSAFNSNDGLVLQTLADMAGMALHNSLMYQHMEELATFDSLTGLTNRRVILRRLEDEWNRARRYQRAISLITMDIDHFKLVNDTYGHSTGDRALQAVASLIKRLIRNVDLIGRMGGDEFLIVLPETDARGGIEVAERICRECEQLNFKLEEGIHVPLTLSVGIVTWPTTSVKSLTELMQAADNALYQSKALGRNRATVFGGESNGL